MFCEKIPFDSLFSSESQVFPIGFLCVSKMYHVRLFIVEKMGFGTTPTRCGLNSKPQPLLQKTCLSYASETLVVYTRSVCIHMLWRAYASRNPHTQAKGHFGHFISKTDFYSFKRL